MLTILILLVTMATDGRCEPFRDNGDGTVKDLATGLTWQREDDNTPRANGPAATYCQRLTLAGGGWRLPTIKELYSLVNLKVMSPAIDSDVFPNTNLDYWWSETIDANDSNKAWFVFFKNGGSQTTSLTLALYVRCVR